MGAHLLVESDDRVLKDRAHAPRSESALCNLPQPVRHGVDNELIGRRTKLEAASTRHAC